MLINLDFVTDRKAVIDYYVNEIEQYKITKEKKEQDLFWSNKKILVSMCDDGCQNFCYILKIYGD